MSQVKRFLANGCPQVLLMTSALHEMALEGHRVTREHVARFSPYMTEHIRRFGEYFLDMSEKPEPLEGIL